MRMQIDVDLCLRIFDFWIDRANLLAGAVVPLLF